jgi:DAK2 domain fusion protein YloV
MEGKSEVDDGIIAAALDEGAKAAYSAVTNPAEGTILTVARETAEALADMDADVGSLLEAAEKAAAASVERTPDLLPVLKEAGVVDAGGEGLRVLLEGMARHLRGESVEADAAGIGEVESDWLSVLEGQHAAESSLFGYCTEVLVEGTTVDVDAMREKMLGLGDSVLVVGDESLLRIHVHTDTPGEVLNAGTGMGSLIQVKVDNMNRQAESFVELHAEGDSPDVTTGAPLHEGQTVSCIAVASGEGLAQLFAETGCARVVSGGPTMNPSTAEILEAIEACPTDDVIVLPNDKNIIMAAEQAVPHTKKNVRVVRTRSIPQGVAAMLAFIYEHDLAENETDMVAALPSVRTIEVTRAVRSTTIGGVKVEAGQAIAVVDDVLKGSGTSADEVALAAIAELEGACELITIYRGGESTEEGAEALAEALRDSSAAGEVHVIFGGQPYYDYILGVE